MVEYAISTHLPKTLIPYSLVEISVSDWWMETGYSYTVTVGAWVEIGFLLIPSENYKTGKRWK